MKRASRTSENSEKGEEVASAEKEGSKRKREKKKSVGFHSLSSTAKNMY
jgi:hypothetical protein